MIETDQTQEPPYGIYKCSDGYILIAQADLDVLAKALDLPERAALKSSRPPQADATALAAWRDAIVASVAAKLLTAPAQHWDDLLAPRGVWCMVANGEAAFLADPQAKTLLIELDHPKGGRFATVAPGIRFSGQSDPRLTTAPAYGAHSREVLPAEGLIDARIADLVASGVVVEAQV